MADSYDDLIAAAQDDYGDLIAAAAPAKASLAEGFDANPQFQDIGGDSLVGGLGDAEGMQLDRQTGRMIPIYRALPTVPKQKVQLDTQGVDPYAPAPHDDYGDIIQAASADDFNKRALEQLPGLRQYADYPSKRDPDYEARQKFAESVENTPVIPAQALPIYWQGAAAEKLGSYLPEGMARGAAMGFAGSLKGGAEALAGFGTLKNVAITGATGAIGEGTVAAKTAQTALLSYFEAEAIHAFPEQYKAYQETKDPVEKAKIATGILVGLGLPIYGAGHSAFGGKASAVDPQKATELERELRGPSAAKIGRLRKKILRARREVDAEELIDAKKAAALEAELRASDRTESYPQQSGESAPQINREPPQSSSEYAPQEATAPPVGQGSASDIQAEALARSQQRQPNEAPFLPQEEISAEQQARITEARERAKADAIRQDLEYQQRQQFRERQAEIERQRQQERATALRDYERTEQRPPTEEELAQREYQSQLSEEADQWQGEHADELLAAVIDSGGLPAKSSPFYTAEMESLHDAVRNPNRTEKMRFGDVFRKDAPDPDELATRLRDRGFEFPDADSLKQAFEDRLRTGRKVYGLQEAQFSRQETPFDKGLQDDRRKEKEEWSRRPIEQQPPRFWYSNDAAKRGIGPNELTYEEIADYKAQWGHAVKRAVYLRKPIYAGLNEAPKGYVREGDLYVSKEAPRQQSPQPPTPEQGVFFSRQPPRRIPEPDLLSRQTEDLTLIGEKGIDHEARQREAERLTREKEEAQRAQDDAQGVLFKLKAHHGTPHEVDQFRLEKIGTGEGAQAYGWGLYFAEAPEVAKQYAKSIGSHARTRLPRIDDLDAKEWGASRAATEVERRAADALARNPDIDWAIDYLKQERGTEPAQHWLENNRDRISNTGGNTYTVEIDAEPHELLDYDKAISQQATRVQDTIAPLQKRLGIGDVTGRELYETLAEKLWPKSDTPEDWTHITQTLNDKVQHQRAASEWLSQRGIKGIQYLDQGSRFLVKKRDGYNQWEVLDGNGRPVAKEPSEAAARAARDELQTRNYVVFDDKHIKITHANGKPFTAAEKAEFMRQGANESKNIDPHTGSVYSLDDATRKAFTPSKDTSANLGLQAIAKTLAEDYENADLGRARLARVDPPRRSTNGSLQAIKALSRKSGAQVVYFLPDRPVRINGARIEDKIFLNVNSLRDPLHVFAAHEIGHVMEKSDPITWKAIHREAKINREAYREYRAGSKEKGYRRYAKDGRFIGEFDREFVSDLFEEAMGDPVLLHKALGSSLAKRVLVKMQEWVNNAIRYLQGREKPGPEKGSASAAVRNLEEVRARIVEALKGERKGRADVLASRGDAIGIRGEEAGFSRSATAKAEESKLQDEKVASSQWRSRRNREILAEEIRRGGKESDTPWDHVSYSGEGTPKSRREAAAQLVESGGGLLLPETKAAIARLEAKPEDFSFKRQDESEGSSSRRLQILQESLKKKEAEFDRRIDEHMGDVRSANGQPLNDKRNGGSTVARWERQNDALRNLKESIETTKRAIEREQEKVDNVNSADTPDYLQAMVDSGELQQWRKHPNHFFVPGVDKARIVWNEEHGTISHKYVSEIPKGTGQYEKFRDAFNKANAEAKARFGKPKIEPSFKRQDLTPEQSPEDALLRGPVIKGRTTRFFYEGARDVFERTPGLQRLGAAVRKHVDQARKYDGEMVAPYRAWEKAHGSAERKQAYRDFEAYWGERERNPQSANRNLSEAGKASQELVELWRQTARFADEHNKGMSVFDDELNYYRPIGSIRDYFPRMPKASLFEMLDHGIKDQAEWKRIVDQLIEEKKIKSEAEAKAYLQKSLKPERRFDYMGNIEKARKLPLPNKLYDYSFATARRYMKAWSERKAQVEAFGQKLGPKGKDFFDIVKEKTYDKATSDYITAVQKRAYGEVPDNIVHRTAAFLNTLVTPLYLGNPKTMERNVISGLAHNVTTFGLKPALKAALDVKRAWGSIDDAYAKGILHDDLMHMMADAEQLSSKPLAKLQRGSSAFMKAIGYNFFEDIGRAHGMLTAKTLLRDAIKAYEKNPNSRASLQYRAFMKRNGHSLPQLAAEGMEGALTDRYLRESVNVAQGGYRYDQVPIFTDSPAGRFLFKFQKWGTQATRNMVKNALAPMMGDEIKITGPDGKVKTVNVRTFTPATRYLATTMLVGQAILGIESAIFGTSPGYASIDEIVKTWDEDKKRALMLALDRSWKGLIAVGGLGIISNYAQQVMDATERRSAKSPFSPPGLGPLASIVDLVLTAKEQGKVTARDLDEFTRSQSSLYRTGKQIGGKAGLIQNEATDQDMRWLNAVTRRYAQEVGEEQTNRAIGPKPKGPLTPFREDLRDALLTGNGAEAKRIVDKQTQGMSGPEKKAFLDTLKTSVRSSQPIRIGGVAGAARKVLFMEWARRRLSPEEISRIRKLDEAYMRAAKAANLIPAVSKAKPINLDEAMREQRMKRALKGF